MDNFCTKSLGVKTQPPNRIEAKTISTLQKISAKLRTKVQEKTTKSQHYKLALIALILGKIGTKHPSQMP